MKLSIYTMLLLPLLGGASAYGQTIENCQVQEFLGASYNEETGKYGKQKWTSYEFDGSDQKVSHPFKLIGGAELVLSMNGEGMIAGADAFVLSVDLKDLVSGVEVSDPILIAKDDSWRKIPMNGSWFIYKRSNRDRIIISCNSLDKPLQ